MQFECRQAQLQRALEIVGQAIPRNPRLPILGHVLLNAQESALTLTTTNLEVGISYRVDCEVAAAGATTVPFTQLREFVRRLPNGPIVASEDSASPRLILRHTRHTATFVSLPAAEFPVLPSPHSTPLVTFPAAVLSEMISQVSCAASGDDRYPILAGVLVQLRGRTVTLTGTDRRRLAERSADCLLRGIENEVGLVVLTRGLLALARNLQLAALTGAIVRLFIAPSGSQSIFQVGPLTVWTRLLEGEYPCYQTIIPTTWTSRVVLTTRALLHGLDTAATCIPQKDGVVNLTLVPASAEATGCLIIAGQDAAHSVTNEIRMPAYVEGPEGQVQLNARYLREALKAMPTPQVVLELPAPGEPILLRPVGSSQYRHVIMPMSL